MRSLSNQRLSISIVNINNFTIETGESIFGVIDAGTLVQIEGTPIDPVTLMVVTVSNGSFSVSVEYSNYLSNIAPYVSSAVLSIVHSDAVQVARYGTGNSTSVVIQIVETADSFVYSGQGGYFKLKLTLNILGTIIEGITPYCLNYHATAEDVQKAINSIGFDFNPDNVINSFDDDHITVTRSGDGSATSGYGYVYTLSFTGPQLQYVRTEVLGNFNPIVEVVYQGHYGGCSDLEGSISSSVQVDYQSSQNKTVWKLKTSSLTYLQSGDRIRLPQSSTPKKTYIIQKANQYSIVVDSPLFSLDSPAYLDILVIDAAIPEYSVRTIQAGEDSYYYEIYFTGPHLDMVPLLIPVVCSSSEYHHFDGMRFGVSPVSTQSGGSEEVQVLQFSSNLQVDPTIKCWKMYINSDWFIGEYTWGSVQFKEDLIAAYETLTNSVYPNVEVSIISNSFGSAAESYGGEFIIKFLQNIGSPPLDGDIPLIAVLTDGEYTDPLYTFNNSLIQLNDLTVSGVFTGLYDTKYNVTIVAHGNSTIKQNDYFITNSSHSPIKIIAVSKPPFNR